MIKGLLLLLSLVSFKVERITFEGLRTVSPVALMRILPFKEGDRVEKKSISDAVKLLYTRDYFSDVKVFYDDQKKELIFSVVEKPRVVEVDVEGEKKIKEKEIKEKITVKIGDYLDRKKIKRDVEQIKSLYEDKGYPFAEVIPEVEEKNHKAYIKYTIKEGSKAYVKEIFIIGNRKIPDSEIKKFMKTKERGILSFITSSGKFKPEDLIEDAERVRMVYLENGYINIRVDEPRYYISPEGRWVYVFINVEEGEQFQIGKVDIDGDLLFEKSSIMKKLRIREGDIFKASNLRHDILYITSLYSNYGYLFANVDPRTFIHPEQRKVDVTFYIEKGNMVYVDRINISGNTKTRDKVIRREMRIGEGDLYSDSRVKLSHRRLYALGFFEDVRITYDVKGSDKVDLNVNVKEGRTGSFSAGIGFSSVENFIATAQASIGNFLGYGQVLKFSFEFGSRRQLYNLAFYDNYFLDTYWSAGIELYNFEYRYVDFSKKSTGGSIRLGYLIGEFTRFYIAYRYEVAQIKSVYGEEGFTVQEGATSSLSLIVTRDTRNHPFDPSRGTYTSIRTEFAGGILGGEFDFTKVSFTHRRYYNPLWKFVIMLGVRVGYGFELHFHRLPYSERYFLGGIDTVRGYDFYSLGPERKTLLNPLDPFSITIFMHSGGNKMVVFNTELLFPLIEEAGIKWVFFFDAGQTYSEEDPMDLRKLRMGWGFGIRWFTPIAPFRFEWGFPINPRPGDDKMIFEFTIGSFF